MKNKTLFMLLLLLPLLLFSQETPPKIGLVLSGGGAKGFAHIGVLKEIEKAGIELHYIGGTSMGAIIGGLFAAGYTANQLEEIVIQTDFLKVLQDINSRESEPFFEKENGDKYIFTLPVSRGKIKLPRGFSKGQNMLNLLNQLLAPVASISNFSKLSIPFFCIATDVESGNQVLLEKGNLPLALRASASFPTLLDPVEIDDTLLIDGGIANNLPTDIMKAKGIDIIIASDVEGKLFKKEGLTSANAILNQVVSYKMYEKSSENKKLVDIYIKPNLENYSVVDFKKRIEILEKGKKTALTFKNVLQKITQKHSIKKPKKKLKNNDTKFLIKKIVIEGIEKYTRAYVLGKLNIQEGDKLSNDQIIHKINYLAATKNYELIKHNIKHQKKGIQLHFKLKENHRKATLKLGLHYDLLYKSGILINYTHKNLLYKNDVLSTDVILGDNLRYNLNYFIDNGFYTSFGFKSRFNQFKNNTRSDQNIDSQTFIKNINLRYTDFTNEVFLQTTFNRKFAIGIGIEFKRLVIATETLAGINDDELFFEKSNFATPFGYLKLDTYNKKYFPTKGFFTDILFKWYAWSDRNTHLNNFAKDDAPFSSFTQLKGKIGIAVPFSKNFSFQFISEVGFNSNTTNNFNSFNFILGGYNQNYINTIVPFYGYEFADLINHSFLKYEFHFRYKFLENNYAMFIANYARVEENILKDFDFFKDIKSGYAVGYSLNTKVGPLELKYSWSPDNNRNYVLFSFGFWF